ncbi:FAD-dependent oxidoreductase domain-containing protein 1 [Helicoverpa armigera]|uniref:FAD-dependent oxidoreductase domain-containing protein 1 n=1 Tax=Helicoverpa armigera TaxID=29058 RepID=UPI0030827416
MTSKKILGVFRNQKIFGVRQYSKSYNPVKKTLNVLANDMPKIMGFKDKPYFYPEHSDIVIIGGGFIGSSVAYWLKKRTGEGLSVVVIEKDFSYKSSQNNVSLGTLTQHFSLPENINLAKYSAEFLRNIKEHLGMDVDIQYMPTGSITLASEEYAHKLEENVSQLNELGVRNNLLTAAEIKSQFPWINTDDVKLGCMALEAEGTFNPWALLMATLRKSRDLGTTYVNGEVIGFELEKQKDVLMEGVTPGGYERINKVIYKTEDGEEYAIKFAICVLAAGHNSGELSKLAKVGTGDGILSMPLTIERRECDIYSVPDKASEIGLNIPLVTDTTGLWLMRNGLESNLLFGNLPLIKEETKSGSQNDYFKSIIEPSLLNRVPSCDKTKIEKFNTEIYDCNTFDNNGVVGPHPYHNNLFIAAGFGKLGCQHAPGIGRAITELIIDSQFTTVDLTRFSFDRYLLSERIVEFNVY